MNYVQQELKSFAQQLKDEVKSYAELLIEMGKKEGMSYVQQATTSLEHKLD